MGQPLSRNALGLLALVGLVACTPKPTPEPARPARTSPPPRDRAARRAETPPPPAPKGPDISGELLVTARVGAVHRLDQRLVALVPSIVPAPLVSGLFTRRLLPELAKDIGLNPLALDALDLTRPAVIALLVRAPRRPGQGPDVRPVALLPLRGEPKLVKDALKVSWPDSVETPWGGVQIRESGRTLAWVHAKDRWVVVAPSGPLLDSAARALEPLATGVPEGTATVRLRWGALTPLFRDIVTRGWQQLRALKAQAERGGVSSLTLMLLPLIPAVEALAPYLASLAEVELTGRIADDAWSWDVKITPTAGGPTATWLSGLKAPKRFGLELLPPGAAAVTSDRRGEQVRLFGAKVLTQVAQLGVNAVVSRDLPAAVAQRGLMDKARPVTLLQYRRALRDLNLTDYPASYAVYRLLFAVKAAGRHFAHHTPKLVALGTGELAGALYVQGGHLGLGMVEGLKDPAAHRRAILAQVVGLQRLGNQLFSALWQVIPKEGRAELNLTQNPFQVVWNPVALRVGRLTASSLSLRLRWPRRPPTVRGRTGGPGFDPRAFEVLEAVRGALAHLFGKGDLTYAWAYAGNRLITTAGHDWQPRMRAMLQRAAPGAKLPGVLTDPLLQNALRDAPADPLSMSLVSGARILVATLAALRAIAPKLISRMPGPVTMLLGQLERDARSARTASRASASREGGAYVLRGRIAVADIKGSFVGAGMLFFVAMRKARSTKSISAPAVAPTPVRP